VLRSGHNPQAPRFKWHTQVDGEFSSLTVTTTG
jgi:hypothetical protein